MISKLFVTRSRAWRMRPSAIKTKRVPFAMSKKMVDATKQQWEDIVNKEKYQPQNRLNLIETKKNWKRHIPSNNQSQT